MASIAYLAAPETGELSPRLPRSDDRVNEHAWTPGLRYSQAVVNSGREAGASVEHSHLQLLSMPFVPGEPAEEIAGFAQFRGNCLLCAVLVAEEDAGHRLVCAGDRVVVVCPYWSGTPTRPDAGSCLEPTTRMCIASAQRTRAAVGRAIRLCLAAMRAQLGDLAYNVHGLCRGSIR